MLRRYARIIIFTAAMLAVFVPSAAAASSQEIITDAISDGYIDGTYTLAQLRAADRAVSPADREYYGWDAAYADAVRRLSAPAGSGTKADEPTVVPVDSNRNGTIDPEEKAKAAAKLAALQKAAGTSATPTAESRNPDNVSKEDIQEELAAGSDGDDGDDGGTPWLAWLLLIVPIAIIGFGIWRMQRTRGFAKPLREDEDDDAAGGSSFATGPDTE